MLSSPLACPGGAMRGEFFRYWGKAQAADQAAPFHLLPFHALDVAAVARTLLKRDQTFLPRIAKLASCEAASLAQVLPFLVALHDLGKFSEPFQDMRPDLVTALNGAARRPIASSLRHDSLGYLLWRSWVSRSERHPSESALAGKLHQIEGRCGAFNDRDTTFALQSWMAAILGHHGRPPEEKALPAEVFRGQPNLAASRRDAAYFALQVHELLQPGPLIATTPDRDELESHLKRASWWIAGFAILCDWLGSDTAHFPYETEPLPLTDYWPRALERAGRSTEASGLLGSSPRAFVNASSLFPAIGESLSPLQRAAETVDLGEGPQLFVLEDLAGSGKTEAALVLAHRLLSAGRGDGLFFALPTMATANAMHGRIAPLVNRLFDGKPNYLLTHSGPRLSEQDRLALGLGKATDGYGRHPSAESVDTASRASSQWLADGRKKALLAELGVGTIDQALLAALQSRHAALRLLGLHRRILVVDEVHACDAYMLEILSALLRLHAGLGGSAILLSATLPLQQRQRLATSFAKGAGRCGSDHLSSDAYPLLTGCGGSRVIEVPVAPRPGCSKTIPVQFLRTKDEVVARLLDAARQERCAVWVRNSVSDALAAWDAVAKHLGPERVTLFHARFALGDRLRIEQDVLDRFGVNGSDHVRRGRIVIATQVVEQSLDVDFDVMISDLAPIDRLIQRAGRLHRHPTRHGGRAEPILEVFAPEWSEEPSKSWPGAEFARTAKVYVDPVVLWRTAAELEDRKRLTLPGEARALVEAVYGVGARLAPAALESRSIQSEGKERSQASVAQMATFRLETGYLRTGRDWSSEARTPTRLGEPTTTVRLARWNGSSGSPWYADCPLHLRWPMSQVSVARRLVSAPAPDDEQVRVELEAGQPFVGEDVVTVVLREQDGAWRGAARAERTAKGVPEMEAVWLSYSQERGLEVSREG